MDVLFAGISVWALMIDNTDETRDRKEMVRITNEAFIRNYLVR